MRILGREISFNRTPKTIGVKSALTSTRNTGRIADADKRIIDKLIKQYTDRSRKDIQSWRQAIALSENPDKPRRNRLHDLYKDLKTDGHYKAQVRLRKYSTLNTEFSIVNKQTGETNEEATNFFNNKWFYVFLSNALDAIFEGPTVIEFLEFNGNKVELKVIPRRNVVPELKAVFPDITKDDFVNYADPYYENWIVEVKDEETELGLMNDIVPNLIWKRNVAQSWAEFCEKFGMPMVTATTNSTDSKEIDRIEYMLQQLGEASTGVFPLGTTVDFKEANRSDTYQVYERFIQFNKDEISSAIVGGNMLTQNGASRSQSEVHERNLDEKIGVSDKRFVKFLVGDVLIPLLINQGYSFIKEGDALAFSQHHNLDLDKFWTITQGVMVDHEVDVDWLSKTFSIPIVGKKKILVPTAKLENIVAVIEGVRLPKYTDFNCSKHPVAVSNGFQKKMSDFHNQLFQEIFENKDTLSSEANIMAMEGLEFLSALQKGWGKRRIQAGWNEPDHLALSMMEYNLFSFSQGKTEARLASLSDLMINKEKLQINSFSDFKTQAQNVTKNFNGTWLETEYNLAIATAQNSAQYLRFMSEKDSVTSFVQYQTAGDERVRLEHQVLDGKVFSLDDKEAMRIYPPNGYGCRCEMVQYLGKTEGKLVKGKTASNLLGDKWGKSEFGYNRGDLKEVFIKQQQYAETNGDKIDKMKFDTTWNLQPLQDMKNLSKALLDKTITPDNVKELFTDNAGTNLMGFEDYLKRKLILEKKAFEFHTKGAYISEGENRHQLFPLVKDALETPNEVWLNPETKETKYVKFYDGLTMVVPVKIENNKNRIATWYSLKIKEDEVRKGILIYNKK